MNGIVFNIEEMTMHDGDGVRLTIFMKGCPLRCAWCHNPEGLRSEPELLYKKVRCTHCNLCFEKCNHIECQKFNRCIYRCPNNCLEICGVEYSSSDLANKINSYKKIFDSTNGGITFSGGEPLLQWSFIKEVISKLDNINVAIETCGYAKEEVFKDMLNTVNFVYMDVKLFDDELHKKYTGVSNKLIKENYQLLRKSKVDYIIRTPIIGGYTDSKENLEKIEKFISGSKWEKLSENKLKDAKYEMLTKEALNIKNQNC